MFLNMNQMQPSICNISPMAPASDGLSVIFPVGQAPSTVKMRVYGGVPMGFLPGTLQNHRE